MSRPRHITIDGSDVFFLILSVVLVLVGIDGLLHAHFTRAALCGIIGALGLSSTIDSIFHEDSIEV